MANKANSEWRIANRGRSHFPGTYSPLAIRHSLLAISLFA
jgi:hypothetical protein